MMRQDSFEDQYMDVLQNLEFAIVQVARKHPDLTDWHAQSAVDALMDLYRAEAAGKEIDDPAEGLNPLPRKVYGLVHTMAEMRLGRGEITTKEGEPVDIPIEPITVQEMYDCLKRIRKSIQTWSKRAGLKGYLRYIDDFFPDAA
jgi:hypothetical protein